jgi:hypothetical protein
LMDGENECLSQNKTILKTSFKHCHRSRKATWKTHLLTSSALLGQVTACAVVLTFPLNILE